MGQWLFEFSSIIALGTKLSFSLVVRALRAPHRLPGGSSKKSWWQDWVASSRMLLALRRQRVLKVSPSAGRGSPMMFWDVCTILWRVVLFACAQSASHDVIQYVRVLSVGTVVEDLEQLCRQVGFLKCP